MSKSTNEPKSPKSHWYKRAVLPWGIIIFVTWTLIVFIAAYFYTMTVTKQYSANVQSEASAIVRQLSKTGQ